MHAQLVGQRRAQRPVEERMRYGDKAAGYKHQAAGNAPALEPFGATAGCFILLESSQVKEVEHSH